MLDVSRFGNRWQQNGPNSFIATFTGNNPGSPQNNNRMDGYSYDAAGNLLNDGTHSYTYDAENRIIQVDAGNTATYVYDADSRRVQKTSTVGNISDPAGTWIFFYDQAGRMVQKFNSPANTFVHGEIYAGGRHLASVGGGTIFSHSDWLGTERFRIFMTNFPNLTESCSSLPLGDGLNCVGSDQDPLHFTGKERDAATGLDNFGARFDSSSFGRFMSPDWSATIVPVPYASLTDPQSLNLYSYVENNPLSRTDPTGHCTADGEKHGFWWCVGHAMGFTETRKEYGARIAIERQWLMSNVAQNSGQVNDMRNASASQVDKVYWQWSEALRTAGCFFGCDEQPEAKDYYRNASGAFVLFRGGSSFAPKAGEFRVDAEGNVGATRGVSVNTDPLKVERFGGAFEIKYLPPELQLIQRGIDVGHFEIVPRQPMSVSRYLELLREIVVEGPKE